MAPKTKRANNGAETNPGNVDKIRDILFGNQMRDYDKRFSKLEDKLLKEASDLREEVKRRFASLESYLKTEVSALVDRDKTEQLQRADADKELARGLKDSTQGWEKRCGQMTEQSGRALRELRQHILEEVKRLTEDLEAKHQDAMSQLDSESSQLRGSLTDRLALSDLFAEVSLRLKNEFKLPKKK